MPLRLFQTSLQYRTTSSTKLVTLRELIFCSSVSCCERAEANSFKPLGIGFGFECWPIVVANVYQARPILIRLLCNLERRKVTTDVTASRDYFHLSLSLVYQVSFPPKVTISTRSVFSFSSLFIGMSQFLFELFRLFIEQIFVIFCRF